MPAPFKQLSREQFADLLLKFPFTRKINAVHMHHTWRPNRAQYKGHETIVAMWRFHTQTNHWRDIAQHITIAPDGSIWLGRDWNLPPASASGHNGTEQAGPFMFEMIGDFDEGKDPFYGEQRRTALEVIARVQQRFGLAAGTLQLHNMMSTKSCPGTSIDYHTVLHDVAALNLPPIGSTPVNLMADGTIGAERQAELQAQQQTLREAIEDLQRSSGQRPDPADAEPCAHDGIAVQAVDSLVRGIVLSPADVQAMRPHLVNLRMGEFSNNGQWSTSPMDVDAIFDDFLPRALQQARAAGHPLRLMFYAHGGLVDEDDALASVRSRLGWWKDNDIYPISFVWETGLIEVLGQMLEQGQSRGLGMRNVFSDNISDPLMEAVAHRAGGVQIWNSMKSSAQRASSGNLDGGAVAGGAWYVARQLADFCGRYGDEVEVHAAGHSAGAIFHAWFLPCALALGVPRVRSLHLLAPAGASISWRCTPWPTVTKTTTSAAASTASRCST